MRPISLFINFLLVLATAGPLRATERLSVAVAHDLSIARPAETVSVPWGQVVSLLPAAQPQALVIRDAVGQSLPYQVIDIAPLAGGTASFESPSGEIIFQHDFAAGEKSAVFSIERSETPAPAVPTLVFARAVPERLDDFAWENDRVAHRAYGPELAEQRDDKEVLVSSGIDVWCKRVTYPIIDRWYKKGRFHEDEGEGMDMYSVGTSRGCGGTGLWDGSRLYVSGNYETARVLVNGPIRAVFELTYAKWKVGGGTVSETKRFTVDAGHHLNLIESLFAAESAAPLTIGIGLSKNGVGKKGEAPLIARDPDLATLSLWSSEKGKGSLGTAIVLVGTKQAGFADDKQNQLILARTRPGVPLRYLAGAGCDLSGHYANEAAWKAYVAAEAERAGSPVSVTIAPVAVSVPGLD